MRKILTSTGLVALSLTLGVGSAALSIRVASRCGAIQVGSWRASATVGSTDSGMYERAAIATHALFVLNRDETFYYRAHTDDAGGDLDARCDYEIRGRPLDARWWSITAYGRDDFLIPNQEKRYSFNMANLAKGHDGSFVIRASARPKPGNWLPLGGSGRRYSLIRPSASRPCSKCTSGKKATCCEGFSSQTMPPEHGSVADSANGPTRARRTPRAGRRHARWHSIRCAVYLWSSTASWSAS